MVRYNNYQQDKCLCVKILEAKIKLIVLSDDGYYVISIRKLIYYELIKKTIYFIGIEEFIYKYK